MVLAGAIVQELCDFLNVTELPSTADFPQEFDALQTVLTMVRCRFVFTSFKCSWYIFQISVVSRQCSDTAGRTTGRASSL